MKRTITFVLVGILAGVSALAQATKPDAKPDAKPLPSADQVLDAYVKALGGKDAVMKLNSRIIKGTFEIPAMGVSATAEIQQKAPNKSSLFIDVPGFGVVQQGFDGTVAWSQDPQSGLREKTGLELAETKRDEDFYRDVKLKELYQKLEVKGVETIGGREAYLVLATPSEGSPDKLYFDKENGLMVRSDIERESPMGRSPVQVFMENYKDVDGVKVAHTIRQIAAFGEFIIKVTEIKHNVPVDEKKFNKPSA
jgi:hypothetical protein